MFLSWCGRERRLVDEVDYARLRHEMVRYQLERHGIRDPRVLDAMNTVPRERFVPARCRFMAYDDTPLPIGFGQTISQPFTVAFMCQALELRGDERVLEVGTGSGYGAAVLSQLAREIHTVERITELYEQARQRIQEMEYPNVHVHLADGTLGLAEAAPFDAIVVTAAAAGLPQPLALQLAQGGRIVIPLGESPLTQEMHRFTRDGANWRVEKLGGFAFVPLIGQYGWNAPDNPLSTD
jgi:protein-L-isoaspartate(D-aspartate) O-methyltransferase